MFSQSAYMPSMYVYTSGGCSRFSVRPSVWRASEVGGEKARRNRCEWHLLALKRSG